MTLYGPCPKCQQRAIYKNGLCLPCAKHRYDVETKLKREFRGHPANSDAFITLVQRIIDRLATMLLEHHAKYDRAMRTGEGLARDIDVAVIQENLWLADQLAGNQYNFIVRRVNERLNGIYALPQHREAAKGESNGTTQQTEDQQPGPHATSSAGTTKSTAQHQ